MGYAGLGRAGADTVCANPFAVTVTELSVLSILLAVIVEISRAGSGRSKTGDVTPSGGMIDPETCSLLDATDGERRAVVGDEGA